jgi:hypothetical protein
MTSYSAATPLLPSGCGGTGPSASLGLLDEAQGYAIGVLPGIWPRGARDAACPIPRTGS